MIFDDTNTPGERLGAIRDLNKLLGLNAPSKVANTDAAGNGLSPATAIMNVLKKHE